MATQSPLTRARQYWTARNTRERRLILIAALVVGGGTFWAVYDWQATERKRLDRTLPSVQAQVKTMQDEAAELGRLRSLSRAPQTDTSHIAEALQGSAAAQNLSLSIRGDGDSILISGNSIPFDDWVKWLASAQNTHALKVQMLDAIREANGLHIEARLARSR